MDEPISWLALELVKERLQVVTIAAGYHTDIGVGQITLDRRQERKIEGEVITLITGGDFTDKPDSSGPRTTVTEMDVNIEVIVPFAADDNPDLIAHRARADVLRALRSGIKGEAQGLRSLKTTGSGFVVGNDGGAVVIVQVSARAGLAETSQPAP